MDQETRNRLTEIVLDLPAGNGSAEMEQERSVAVRDLVAESEFEVATVPGPYRLNLSITEDRLVFDIMSETDESTATHPLSLVPFRRILKDYRIVCDSYREALRSGVVTRIEAIDMGRRGIHDEAAELLRARLSRTARMDFQTARRLFTLIAALHWRGTM
ncbi:Uncharacterized protein, UPF0262 family [Faunimonas pinastri]|uniref:Uncharacterized protein, UPF0262 family n=1 Tax=Faunimonas pinastri TaxID=1855383 RepID=A0A1H9ISN2_9HYPH|nr:UPF0262 family protein [Faunimonas pinastri]SEQ77566.1 Uncharacterized protein, UPF0262 family [Faunimonas pinastri]